MNTLFNHKKENYYMLCIPISTQKFGDSKINYLAQYIEKMVENAYAIYLDKEIAVLINIHETDYTLTMNRLITIGEIYDLNLGMSQPFYEISDMNTYYLQAKRAVEAGKLSQNSTIYAYPDIVIYDILNTLSKTEDLKYFQSSEIDILQEYDKKHGTEYLKTLVIYLDKCGNTSEIAQVLFTHRNTILHRITKIEEICKLNLSNNETRLKLSISLKIHNILKHYSS